MKIKVAGYNGKVASLKVVNPRKKSLGNPKWLDKNHLVRYDDASLTICGLPVGEMGAGNPDAQLCGKCDSLKSAVQHQPWTEEPVKRVLAWDGEAWWKFPITDWQSYVQAVASTGELVPPPLTFRLSRRPSYVVLVDDLGDTYFDSTAPGDRTVLIGEWTLREWIREFQSLQSSRI